MPKDYLILMADIVNSRNLEQATTMFKFKDIVRIVNETWQEEILSPLTITLGDEFQGLVRSLRDAVTIIYALEEGAILGGFEFKLRYILYEGTIDTPVNSTIAYGMMGDGLTKARECLDEMKQYEVRFNFVLKNQQQSGALNSAFFLSQRILESWKPKDYELVSSFLYLHDYKEVARQLKKDRSLMWKREKSLRIDEYLTTKSLVSYLISSK